MDNIEINDIEDISKLLDYVHDQKFDLEEITYDQTTNELTLKVPVVSDDVVKKWAFLFLRKWKNPVYLAQLKMCDVTEFSVSDPDGLGEGLINKIEYENGRVRVVCSNLVVLEAKARRFSISLVPGNQPIDYVLRIGLKS